MDDELTLELNNPLTEEQWDAITDVDFDHTDSVTFHTKHGKEVEFVKRKTGRWKNRQLIYSDLTIGTCTNCGLRLAVGKYCPNCGCKMEAEHETD